MKKLKSIFLVLLMAIMCLVVYYVLIAITDDGENNKSETGNNSAQEENTAGNGTNQNQDNQETQKTSISLVAVGDNFAHESVIESGKQSDGTYNYDFLFDNIRDYIETADIAAIFQTMIIAGNDKGVSGYPSFNTPEEMMTSIDNAGFDVALMASNHSNDMGTVGITDCMSLWNEKSDVLPVGINSDQQESVNIPIMEIKGKKIAVLNYTTNMNKPIANTSEQFMVNYLGALNATTGEVSSSKLSELVINDIKRAEDQADFVIVFPYWGQEYEHAATDTQKAWAKAMTEAGADLIIGARSHYIGEIEEITADNGNKSMCYYSLGNFSSSFNYPNAMVGGMARVTIVFEEDKAYVDTENSGMMPIVTHYTHSEDDVAKITGIYPISLYTSEMASSHGIITRGQVEFDIEIVEKIISDNIKSQYLMRE